MSDKLKSLVDRITFEEGILIVRDEPEREDSEIAVVTGSHHDIIRELMAAEPSFIIISPDDDAGQINSKIHQILDLESKNQELERKSPEIRLASLLHDIGEIEKPTTKGGGFDYQSVNDRWNRRKRK